MADILRTCQDSVGKTRIMYQANLSFALLQKYIDKLTREALIEVMKNGRTLYKLSAKGERFLKDCESFVYHSQMARDRRRSLEQRLAQKVA